MVYSSFDPSWSNVWALRTDPVILEAGRIVFENSDGTFTVFLSTSGAFTFDADGRPTGGAIDAILRVADDTTTAITEVTNIGIEITDVAGLIGSMLALRGSIGWFDLIDQNAVPVLFTSTSIVLANVDGTYTVIEGSDLNAVDLSGTVTSVLHVDVDQTTPLATISTSEPLAVVAGALSEAALERVTYSFALSGDNVVVAGVTDFQELDGGPGNDTLIGNAGSQMFISGNGDADTIQDDAGAWNGIAFWESRSGVNLDLAEAAADGTIVANITGIFGSMFDDSLAGDDGINWIVGELGNDELTGRGGSDGFGFFAGGYGGTIGNDVITDFVSGTDSITIGGFDGIFSFDDLLLSDDLDGNAVIDLGGGRGTITLLGVSSTDLSADDFFVYGPFVPSDATIGDDDILGTSGDDFIDGLAGNDTIDGGSGFDTLIGDDGDDTLIGGADDDELSGGPGNDTMSGGDGADRFFFDFNAFAYDGDDRITDFNPAVDTVYLSGFPGISGYADLDLADDGFGNTILNLPNASITFEGVAPADLTSASFEISSTVYSTDYDVWSDVFTVGNGPIVATANEIAFANTDGTLTVFISNDGSFTYDADGNLTGGTAHYMQRVAEDGTTSLMTATTADVDGPALYTSVLDLLATRSTISWFAAVNQDSSPVSFSDTEIVLENTDGTYSVIVGSGFDGQTMAGTASGLLLVDTDGMTELDAVAISGSLGYAAALLFNGMLDEFVADAILAVDNIITADAPLLFGNHLEGGDGNDLLIGNTTSNTFEGGAGDDTLDGSASYWNEAGYWSAAGSVTVDLASGTATGADGTDTLINIDGVSGSDFDDDIAGNDRPNWIAGNGGNDRLTGGGGSDIFSYFGKAEFGQAPAGNDVITDFNPAVDIIELNEFAGLYSIRDLAMSDDGHGNTLIDLGPDQGSILLLGMLPADLGPSNFLFWHDPNVIDGTPGDDLLIGTDGFDIISGNDGNDTIDGAAGDDDLAGGDGADRFDFTFQLAVSGYKTIADFTPGVDVIKLTGYPGILSFFDLTIEADPIGGYACIYLPGGDVIALYNIAPEALDETSFAFARPQITGTDGDDVLRGTVASDDMFGLDGDDRFMAGAGDDAFMGGNGIDTVDYRNDSVGVSVDLVNGGAGGTADGDLYDSIERIFGTNFADTLIGSDNADTLVGYDGDDTIDGGAGDDALRGGGGNDEIQGGDGSDMLFGEDGNDIIYGGNGDDIARGDAGNDVISGDAGDDFLRGGDGDDVIRGGGDADRLLGEAGADTLDGGTGDDVLRGGDDGDTLYGGDGNDDLFGEGGDDIIFGNDGDDTIHGDAGADAIDGGTGIDVVDYSASAAAVTVNLLAGAGHGGDAEGDTYTGVERAIGSAYSDVIDGDNRANLLIGGDGNDLLFGNGGRDSLRGGEGNDLMDGGNGDDRLFGGTGDDWLTGGSGTDTFMFGDPHTTDGEMWGVDTIMDFVHGSDHIDMSLLSHVNGIGDLTISDNINGNAVISDGLGNTITLYNVASTDISADDFIF